MMYKPDIESGDITGSEQKKGFWRRAWEMYRDGFRNMSRTSCQLWVLILVKLFIMFAILRVFFFPNFLRQQADTPEGRSDFVGQELIDRAAE